MHLYSPQYAHTQIARHPLHGFTHVRSFGKTAAEMRDRHSLNSFYLLGSDGRTYYYTHLATITVRPGQTISRGQQVATVGAYNGKNAHLHLAVSRPGTACELLTRCTPTDARGCK